MPVLGQPTLRKALTRDPMLPQWGRSAVTRNLRWQATVFHTGTESGYDASDRRALSGSWVQFPLNRGQFPGPCSAPLTQAAEPLKHGPACGGRECGEMSEGFRSSKNMYCSSTQPARYLANGVRQMQHAHPWCETLRHVTQRVFPLTQLVSENFTGIGWHVSIEAKSGRIETRLKPRSRSRPVKWSVANPQLSALSTLGMRMIRACGLEGFLGKDGAAVTNTNPSKITGKSRPSY